ncbi:hypothetical protein C2S51_014372 [Perilla frutescens var. frutescens]|nr:hypothetical protein C2S51_014372 [Perilla frutescens var. frutescens]
MAKISARAAEHRTSSDFNCYSRNFDPHRTSFDEECRKIQQYEVDLASVKVNSSERSLSEVLIQEDMHILKQKNKETVVKRTQKGTETVTELIDQVMETGKEARRKSLKAYQSCLCQSNDSSAMGLSHEHPSTSAEVMSLNRPAAFAGIQRNRDEVKLSQGFRRSIVLEKYECVDTKMQQGQMSSGKDRKLTSSGGARIESKPFTDALEVLNLDKDLFISEKCIKNFQISQVEKESQQSNKTVTLKSLLQNRISSETSFSVSEIKRKLRHTFGSRSKESKPSHNRPIFGHDCIYRGVETRNPSSSTANAKAKENLGKKQGLKVERVPHVAAWETDSVRRKIDVSSDRLSEKHGVDAALEATRDLAARLIDLSSIEDLKNERFISSHEIEPCFSPRRDSQYCSGSAQVSLSFSPMRTNKEITPYDGTTEALSMDTSSSLVPSSDEETQDAMTSPTPNMKFNDMPNVVETNNILHSEARHGSLMHSIMDSITENETFSNTADDFASKYQEEHQSPVSVLDQFFTEDLSSPSNTSFQSAQDSLKPRRLHFEEHTLASPSQVSPTRGDQCMHEQDYSISNYVRWIFQASSLNWDQLLSLHLVHPSLFDQAQFLLSEPHFDTRLLFDHVNEVLLETQRSHFISPYWPALVKPRICSLPLEEAVVDEIMREAEFYLLPRTQKRTLDQLVARDFSGSRLQLDFQPETEEIIIHISEDILEESVLDVILQLHS